jgi:ABC-2 type transport system permease protein
LLPRSVTVGGVLARSVFGKAVYDHRRGLLAWVAGVAALVALYVSLYPNYNTPQMAETMETFPDGLMDAFGLANLTTPEGYLQSTVFGLMAPLLLIVFGAARAGRTLAGEEEDGTLDLVLAHPVSRARLLLERYAAVAAELGVLGLVVLAVILAVAPLAELDAVGAGNVAAAVTGLVLVGVCFAALATATAAVTGRRSAVGGVTVGVAVAGYVADTVAPNVDALAWAETLSPFYYASGNDPLANGLSLGHAAVLLVVTAVLLALAVAAFDRRDLAV